MPAALVVTPNSWQQPYCLSNTSTHTKVRTIDLRNWQSSRCSKPYFHSKRHAHIFQGENWSYYSTPSDETHTNRQTLCAFIHTDIRQHMMWCDVICCLNTIYDKRVLNTHSFIFWQCQCLPHPQKMPTLSTMASEMDHGAIEGGGLDWWIMISSTLTASVSTVYSRKRWNTGIQEYTVSFDRIPPGYPITSGIMGGSFSRTLL